MIIRKPSRRINCCWKAASRAFGNYPTLKEFIVTMMVQAVVNVQSKYGEEAAMKELMGMMTEAAQQYCEETKGDEKREVLN